jgi:putative thioredoxin
MEIEVSENNFNEEVVEKSKKIPVLVDFWASWCGPCMMLKPMLEKIVKDYGNKLVLATVNVSENENLAEKFEVMSIPSVKLFKNGEIVDEFVGVQPESKIREWINKNLN